MKTFDECKEAIEQRFNEIDRYTAWGYSDGVIFVMEEFLTVKEIEELRWLSSQWYDEHEFEDNDD